MKASSNKRSDCTMKAFKNSYPSTIRFSLRIWRFLVSFCKMVACFVLLTCLCSFRTDFMHAHNPNVLRVRITAVVQHLSKFRQIFKKYLNRIMYVSWTLQNGGHPGGPPLKMHTNNHIRG